MITTAVDSRPKPVAARWIGATFTGWSAGFVLSILLLVAVESVGIRQTQFPLAFSVPVPFSLAAYVGLGGIVVGLIQQRILASVTRRAWWWAPGAALGWVLGGGTVFLAEWFDPPGVTGLAAALMYVTIVLLGGVALGAVGAAVLHAILEVPAGSRDGMGRYA